MMLNNLIILNEVETPCAYLVCEILNNGKVKYINKSLRKRFGEMSKSDDSTTLAEFGFKKIGEKFVLSSLENSTAKYSDGKPRYWQGKQEFTYDEIVNMKKFD